MFETEPEGSELAGVEEESVVSVRVRATDLDQIAEQVKRLRARRGWSQAELSRRSGVSQAWISDLERGVGHRPSTVHLSAVATALGTDWRELTLEAAPPTEEDLPTVLREKISKLPIDLRDVVGQAIERYQRLPDTPENRAAFVKVMQVVVTFLEGLAAKE